MKIGELARVTGTQVETIRYYERAGLLPAPPRTGGNYRIYGDEHVARLTFIRHCRVLDMALDDVRRLLMVKDASGANCGTVNRLLDDHIVRIRERIETLQGLEDSSAAASGAVPGPARRGRLRYPQRAVGAPRSWVSGRSVDRRIVPAAGVPDDRVWVSSLPVKWHLLHPT
jgi:DNA-binding transcriptional MerR regulator